MIVGPQMKSPRLVMVTLVGSLLLVHLAVCRVLPTEEDDYYYADDYYYNYYGGDDTQEGEAPLESEPVEPVAPPEPVEVHVGERPIDALAVATTLPENASDPDVNATVPAPPAPAAPVPHKIPSKCRMYSTVHSFIQSVSH